MEHLNFSRQMVKQFSEQSDYMPEGQLKQRCKRFMAVAKASQKFILPDGGVLYEDDLLKGIDESERLRLPFPVIAVEYTRSENFLRKRNAGGIGTVTQPTKGLFFALEGPRGILVFVTVWNNNDKIWFPLAEVLVPAQGYLHRDADPTKKPVIECYSGGTAESFGGVGVLAADVSDEVRSLISMLNILCCKNVHVEDTPTSVAMRASSKKGQPGALPFDTYHMLTIDSAESGGVGTGGAAGNRSPREHLRRGHIRRLSDGRRVWVNATVVAAGRPGGVVRKDYAVHHRFRNQPLSID